MNSNKSKKVFQSNLLQSASDTSTDEDYELIDLFKILKAEELLQRKRFVTKAKRKGRKYQKPNIEVNAKLSVEVKIKSHEAVAPKIRILSTKSFNKNFKSELNDIEDEVFIVHLENWEMISDEEMWKLFRVQKSTFQKLLVQFESFEHRNENFPNRVAKGSKILLIFLAYAGHQISIKGVSQKIGIYGTSCRVYIDFVIDFLLSLAKEKMCLPQKTAAKLQNAQEFYNFACLKNVIGCVEKLSFRFHAHDSLSRNPLVTSNTNSFNVEVACDARGRFLAQDTGTLDSKLASVCNGKYCFLASLKFSIREWIITPCKEDPNNCQQEERGNLNFDQQFNEKFLTTYAVLTRSVKQLQHRFRQLLCIDTRRLAFARRFLHACFVLHNFAIDCNDYWCDDENIFESGRRHPIVVDAMVESQVRSELDRYDCPQGIEKRQRMIYETCIWSKVDDEDVLDTV